MDKCSICGKCQDIRQFKAIVIMSRTVLTFPEMCHSCGGCMLICPEKAITETVREIGSSNGDIETVCNSSWEAAARQIGI